MGRYRYQGVIYARHPSFVLGFHGCDREVAERVLSGDENLSESSNSYDWLGSEIYFWDHNHERAKQWAVERMNLPDSTIREPYAIGAIIDLGACLSLLQSDHIQMVESAYELLRSICEKNGSDLPKNRGGDDRLIRHLDCAVIQTLHHYRSENGLQPFDTVRSVFQEGGKPYPDAGFHRRNHIQICVRNLNCIKGYFRPIEAS